MTEWSRQIALKAVLEGRKSWHLEADAAERDALAARFGLIAIDKCAADIEISPIEGGIMVSGDLRAAVIQRCVRSLDPFPAVIAAPFAIRYLREIPTDEAGEEIIDPEDPDDIELLPDDGLDIGEIAAQSLGLALDPYPRAPDSVLPVEDEAVLAEEPRHGRQTPFTVLKNIRDMT